MNDILSFLLSNKNPQQYAYNQLCKMADNPIVANVLKNPNSIESVARNLAKEQKVNLDELISRIYGRF